MRETTDKTLGRELRRRARSNGDSLQRRVRYGPLGREVVNLGLPATGYLGPAGLRYQGHAAAVGGSGDYHLRYEIDELRAESQRFYRLNGIYKAMVQRVVDVMLGSGLTLQAKGPNRRLNDRFDEAWRNWWIEGKPEVRQLDNGHAIERFLLEHVFVDGAHLVIKDPATKLIQLIEAERLGSTQSRMFDRRIVNGIELDVLGRPLAFWVRDYTNEGQVSHRGVRRKAADCEYLANRERISQTAGVPVQQCNFAMFHRLNDVLDSEAAAWQVLSRLAVAIYTENAERFAQDSSTPDEGATDADIAQRIHDLDYALIFHGRAGDKIEGISRNIPGVNFTESVKTFMRLLGLPFGFSLEFTLLIWSDTNYSSGRASAKQVERNCRKWLTMLRAAMAGIYTWKARHWLKEWGIGERPGVLKHEFHPQPYPFIDPQKEADASETRIDSGQSCWSRELKAEGRDDDENVAERAQDFERRAEAIIRHNKKYADNPEVHLTMQDYTGIRKPREPAATAAAAAPGVE